MIETISTLTICQDEEQFIIQMLNFLQEVVKPEQIVIVDGGSKDNTLELINKFKNTTNLPIDLYQRTMPMDFSDQRNFALSKCTGDWVLHIDVDETYSKNMADLINDMRNGKFFNVDGFLFPTAHLFGDQFHMTDDGGDTHIRLFRNSPTVQYVGEVHEKPSVEGVIIPVTDIALRHYSMLKNEEGLHNKGKRWALWGEQTNHLGINLRGENHFVNAVKNFKGKLYDVPKEWE